VARNIRCKKEVVVLLLGIRSKGQNELGGLGISNQQNLGLKKKLIRADLGLTFHLKFKIVYMLSSLWRLKPQLGMERRPYS
jgi:hypothetical protein